MEFDKKNLLKLGKLARISIKDDKLDSLGEDLNSILKFVDQLQEIKTDQVDPTSNSLEQKLLSREDIVEKINEAEDVLENAPEQEMNFYVVPKVIE
jgi:aspartyl-tRNA(Asn)/glutamyl-tRNA(Gln) amidotransferase subunit C